MLVFLDIMYMALHLVAILFNLSGWICKKTRRLHLWIVGITLISWLILGLKHGFGYCFLTDWHWDVKRKLGEADLPHSFIQYIFEELGLNIAPSTTDYITAISFILAIAMSIYFNFIRKH